MTKKKLNIDTIANELEGASLFFTKAPSPLPMPKPEEPLPEKVTSPLPESHSNEKSSAPLAQFQNENIQDQKRSFERTLERTDERSNERLNERPPKLKREKIRHTFDI